MTNLQEQYVAIAKQGQEAVATVAGAWTRSLQDSAFKVPVKSGQAVAHQLIDQVFDFATTVIAVQRNLTKQLVTSSASVAEDVAQQATSVANETTEKVAKVARRTTSKSA